eukprot:605370-Pelagomonas_calceolata.AAC.1
MPRAEAPCIPFTKRNKTSKSPLAFLLHSFVVEGTHGSSRPIKRWHGPEGTADLFMDYVHVCPRSTMEVGEMFKL